MAYDETLAQRVRALLADRPVVREVRMFGGLSFMVDEKLVVAADTHGRLMLKVDPDASEALLARPGAAQGEMKGRSMGPAWITVADTATATDADLGWWVAQALEHHDRQRSS